MIQAAESVEAVEHIYNSVDHLFGFEHSPAVHNERREWDALSSAKADRIEELTK